LAALSIRAAQPLAQQQTCRQTALITAIDRTLCVPGLYQFFAADSLRDATVQPPVRLMKPLTTPRKMMRFALPILTRRRFNSI
jgi:hypothetical protein